MKKQDKFGTREWADRTINCCTGCSNNCRYCYARGMAVRFNRLKPEEWPLEKVRQDAVDREYGKFDGPVMFPSSHDITPGNLDACLTVLRKLLDAGNNVLVVSKPRWECIERICDLFGQYKNQILFRFTIGAMDNQVLSFWEPGASEYEERKASLLYAYFSEYQTSVSIEPMLDAKDVINLVEDLELSVTESIWIGKMNHIRKNIVIDSAMAAEAVREIERGQTDEAIIGIYETLKDHPLIKWKESVRKIISKIIPPIGSDFRF